jgi:hypothetical protein
MKHTGSSDNDSRKLVYNAEKDAFGDTTALSDWLRISDRSPQLPDGENETEASLLSMIRQMLCLIPEDRIDIKSVCDKLQKLSQGEYQISYLGVERMGEIIEAFQSKQPEFQFKTDS